MKIIRKVLTLLLMLCVSLSLCSECTIVGATNEASVNKDEILELPDIIDTEEAEKRGYVARVKTEEKDLYTFVFQNQNGTRTMRVYSHPVKYMAENGTIRDISLAVQKNKEGDYVSADHEIITTFERYLPEGISLKYEDVEILMIPNIDNVKMPMASLSEDGKIVTYEVSDTTSFVYELTYAGFKEDIVVEKYTGQTEYDFTIYTNGLSVYEEEGAYYLVNQEGEIEAGIGDIIVFTADERNNTMGKMTYETIRENQEYVMTIHLDEDYLADENTTYPIRIDPTIEINYNNNGTGAIEDVTINDNKTFSGTSGSLNVGRHSTGSLSRVLMHFPNLQMPVTFAPMILSAQVEIRDLMCQGDEDITIECYTYSESAPSWSESDTTTWDSVGTSYLSSFLDCHTISYGNGNAGKNRYAFDITSLAKLWADGDNSPEKGIVFKAEQNFENQTGDDVKYWFKTFASFNRSSNKPSLSITYETKSIFTIRNSSTGAKYLTATSEGSGGATFSTNLNVLDGTQLWCVEYLPEYETYNIISMGMRYEGGRDPYVIYSTPYSVGLERPSRPTANRQYIPIHYAGYGYYFKNIDTNYYLSISTSSDVLTTTATQNSYARFYPQKIETDTFNNFWSGSFNCGIYDGVAHIKIELDSSITSSELYGDNDFSSALLWNGITDNVIIYGPNDTVPSGITPFYVTFVATTSISSNTYGITIPDVNYATYNSYSGAQQTALLKGDWDKVTIYLNNNGELDNPFYWAVDEVDLEAQINKVICHEMGHALKLAHPSQTASSGSKHTFDGNRGDYAGQEAVYSIMNQGRFNDTNTRKLTAALPQVHDMINLISKWEYHIDCTH